MVDPTKGIGPIQSLISGTRVSEPAQQPRRANDAKEPTGTPQIVTQNLKIFWRIHVNNSSCSPIAWIMLD